MVVWMSLKEYEGVGWSEKVTEEDAPPPWLREKDECRMPVHRSAVV